MLLSGGSRLAAATIPERQQADENQAKMKTEGWKQISEGVFERQLGPNKVEHLGYGREGLAWTIGDMNQRIERLRKENEAYPSEKLTKTIDELTFQSAKARHELWRMEKSSAKGLSSITAAVTGASCSSICYSATADAYPLTATQGVGAVADATFNSTCGYSGDTYAYAYARATLGGTTTTITQSDPHTGTSVTSHAAGTVNGGSVTGTPCYSEASASATSTALGISYSTSDTNSSCPAPSCSVAISGTSYEYFSGPGCRSRTWTAVVSGGCTATSYQWKIGTTVVGTGSTYTKSICPATASFTLLLTVNGTMTDSHSVVVDYEPCECCGGGICP
jgi:hypothetical protein